MQKTSRDNRLSSTQKKLISRLREVGKNGMSAYRFHDGALAKIIALVEQLCAPKGTLLSVTEDMRLAEDIFDTSPYWFVEPLDVEDFVTLYLEADEKIDDFSAVFELVYEVVKRRLRFQWIEENQEMPSAEQLAIRAVLENGFKDEMAKIANILWRKFWGTIDNRSAAEAGYLTEKVITSCLCGESYSDKDSPITRFGEGKQGRQIDCIVEDLAYEVKTRITGAASGRGRSRDELELPMDCRDSGYTPVLMVMDGTPCAALDQMIAVYEAAGGYSYIGISAWEHLRQEASPNINKVVEDLILRPMEAFKHDVSPMDIAFKYRDGKIIIIISTPEGEVHDQKLIDRMVKDFA